MICDFGLKNKRLLVFYKKNFQPFTKFINGEFYKVYKRKSPK